MSTLIAPIGRFPCKVSAHSKTRLGRDGEFRKYDSRILIYSHDERGSRKLGNPMLHCACALRSGDRIGASSTSSGGKRFNKVSCRRALVYESGDNLPESEIRAERSGLIGCARRSLVSRLAGAASRKSSL